jgi:SAM-dependent methyltransferase
MGPADVRAREIPATKQPGHWLLASIGKTVLRPGGLELTRRMLEALTPGGADDVVEFAPGLGITARMVLSREPRSYVAVEREPAAARRLRMRGLRCIEGSAEATGLSAESASIVYGEAMLTMQTHAQKLRIVKEAHRVLRPGGRYAVHELLLRPDEIAEARRKELERELSKDIHVGVQPLTAAEWRSLFRMAGFQVIWEDRAPMHLLEPRRVLQDEGVRGVLRIAFNILRKPVARQRVLRMRRLFRRFQANMAAVSFVCVKADA